MSKEQVGKYHNDLLSRNPSMAMEKQQMMPQPDKFCGRWLRAIGPQVSEAPANPPEHLHRGVVGDKDLWYGPCAVDNESTAWHIFAVRRRSFEARIKPTTEPDQRAEGQIPVSRVSRDDVLKIMLGTPEPDRCHGEGLRPKLPQDDGHRVIGKPSMAKYSGPDGSSFAESARCKGDFQVAHTATSPDPDAG
jgi:hypothetical protein